MPQQYQRWIEELLAPPRNRQPEISFLYDHDDRLMEDIMERVELPDGTSILRRRLGNNGTASAAPCPCRECVRHRLSYGTRTFDAEGYCPDGYDRDGYDFNGYNIDGFGRDGYNADGYNAAGFDSDGLDVFGFNEFGFDSCGYNRSGYDADGYDRHGYDINGFDEEGYDDNGVNYDGYDRNGIYVGTNDNDPDYDDFDDYEPGLLSYDYRPHFRLHGEGPVFFGIELEVSSDNSYNTLDYIRGEVGQLAYLKSDGSVDGFELVTHPMSYDWAMEHFPWDMLPKLRSRYDCRVRLSENGMHIHVSRAGFDGAAHLFRWMKFIYRNELDVSRIARRSSNQWAQFHREVRSGQIYHAKNELRHRLNKKHMELTGGYRGANFEEDPTAYGRYHAINTQNQETLEMRMFASTLNPAKAKRSLQLAAASVEYTRQLRSHDVIRGGWTWGAFTDWLADDLNASRYPELAETEASTEDRELVTA